MFYLAPLLLLALAVWVERGHRLTWQVVAAVVLAAGLPGVIPYTRFINPSAVSDTFALLPWWNLQDSVISGSQVRPVVIVVAACLGAFFLFVPRKLALAAPTLVLVVFALSAQPVADRIEASSVGSLYTGIRSVEREWIDEALPEGASAAFVWSGSTSAYVPWLTEFFNRAVGPIYDLAAPLPGNLPETSLTIEEPSGRLLDGDGRAVPAEYALSDGSVPLAGEPVAGDSELGVTLYRVGGPLVVTARVQGLHPSDTWSGPELTYTRLGCAGGRLLVTLTSDPHLFTRPQTVTAFVGGREVGRTSVAPDETDRLLAVPLTARAGRCEVRFAVSPTAVPAEVVGGPDTRELGIHFTSFRYEAL